MSLELEKMGVSFLNAKVPEAWEKVAYLSLKPLGSWVKDLIDRLAFFLKWNQLDINSFWISAFFFP